MKKIIIPVIIVFVIAVLFFGYKFMSASPSTSSESEPTPTPAVVYPTITADVKVDIKARADKKAVTLDIQSIPSDVESIEYEITYDTAGGLTKGVGGGPIYLEGKTEINRPDITLGSCSTGGKCSYDEGVKAVNLSVKFNRPSGPSVFQKTYEI